MTTLYVVIEILETEMRLIVTTLYVVIAILFARSATAYSLQPGLLSRRSVTTKLLLSAFSSSLVNPTQEFTTTMRTSCPNSSHLLRIVFNGGDNMLGRAVQLSFPVQSPGEADITDSCPASHYLDLALHPSAHPDGDPSIDKIRRLNAEGKYLWNDYRNISIDPPPDLRLLNFESHITETIDNEDVPTLKGIRYHTHIGNLDAMLRPYAETTHGTVKSSPVVVSVANNHVMDYGRIALERETIPALVKLEKDIPSLKAVGCGRDFLQASMPAMFDFGPKGRVEVFAASSGCSGTPDNWSAKADRSGLVGLPGLYDASAVEEAVKIVKRAIGLHSSLACEAGRLRILSIHMGPNWAMKHETESEIACRREFCHRIIEECGVDIVYGHSSHHSRGMEVHKGKLILYGTGDIINDYEGFENRGEEKYNKLGGIYVADIDPSSGDFKQLMVIPMYMNRLRLERFTERSQIWNPNEKRLVKGNERGSDLAHFVNNMSMIDAGGEDAALKVHYVKEEESPIKGGPVLLSSNTEVG